MELAHFEVGPLATNCYILYDAQTRDAAIIDPGAQADILISFIRNMRLNIRYILNTHGHYDHIGANGTIRKAFPAPVLMHKDDASLAAQGIEYFSPLMTDNSESAEADRFVEHADTINLADTSIKVLHTPGHSPGGVSYYCKPLIFCGDTLFFESIGRTDLPGGNYDKLLESIRSRIMSLPAQTIVYPGHGPGTTVEHETQANPFLKAQR